MQNNKENKQRLDKINTLHKICKECGRKPSVPGYCYKCWKDMYAVIVKEQPLTLTFSMEDN